MADKMNQDNFLQQVEQIENIVKGLASSNENEANQATKQADEYLAKEEKKKEKKYLPIDNTGVNRTVINQRAFDEIGNENKTKGPPNIDPNMDQAGFMAMMEQDALERRERKIQSEKESMVWKDKGNEEFKKGNYEKAVEHYSQALSIFKDTTVLWTNRAQAYIKLGEYEKALNDCDWATRVFENCLKAYIHQGRAHLGLKQYDKAIQSYERAKQIEPKKESIINEYIKEAELAEKTETHEKAAAEFQQSGEMAAEGLVGVLQKVNKPDQLPMFYSGGLRIIAEALKNTNERTLFRTQGGLLLIKDHCLIAKCFRASPRSLSRDEIDVCAATFLVLHASCTDNEENQRQLLEQPDFPSQVLRFVECKVKHTKFLKESVARLLFVMSESDTGRSKLVNNFEVARLITCLFHLMKLQGPIGVTAVGLLNNLALHKKFKQQIRDKLSETLPAFETLMTEGAKNPAVLPACISTITNLCSDVSIRKTLTNRKEIWQACNISMKNNKSDLSNSVSTDILHATLGLLSNLTFEKSQYQTEFQLVICHHCCDLISENSEPRLQERALIVLGHVLPNSTDAVEFICEQGSVLRFLEFIKSGSVNHVKGAIKCLTVCTQSQQSAGEQVYKYKSGCEMLVDLLTHNEEVVIGNAALCLSHCVQLPNVASRLAKTNIIMDLLTLARDGKKHTVQHNCAILIAKLCQTDQRHLERLRELDGIGILHDVMNHVKE